MKPQKQPFSCFCKYITSLWCPVQEERMSGIMPNIFDFTDISDLRTSGNNRIVQFDFKSERNLEVGIKLNRSDLPQLLSTVRAEIAPTDGLPIDLATFRPGTVYSIRNQQIVEKGGQTSLCLHLDIQGQDRVVTLDIPLSADDIRYLLQMLAKRV